MSGIKSLPASERPIDRPLVSIITPVLNGEKYIADTVKSVLSQTYPYIEHIVIDGNSRDNTISIIKALNPKAIVFSEPDKGATDAMNKGLQIAKGEIIGLLNYDDYYANSNVIQKVVNEFLSKPDVKVLYGKVKCINPQTGETLFLVGTPSRSKEFTFRKVREVVEGKTITYPGTFTKREVYNNVGPFSLEYDICTDYEYYLRVIKLYEPYFLNEILTIMRRRGRSDRNAYRGHREVYKLIKSNGINPISALTYLFYRYSMTFFSLTLQKIGLKKIVFFYRKLNGKL